MHPLQPFADPLWSISLWQGTILVNEVIKLEELESRWPALQRRICGFAHSPYAEDAELKRNPSSHGHYSEYYDEATKRLVDQYVGVDLAAFEYTFERPSAAR